MRLRADAAELGLQREDGLAGCIVREVGAVTGLNDQNRVEGLTTVWSSR
jgi:hypothetical protein